MFLILYMITSLFAFFGRQWHEGRLTGRCGGAGCRYDLSGHGAEARCPECGSHARERTPGWSEIVGRPEAALAYAPTLIAAMLLAFKPEWLVMAVRAPVAMATTWRGFDEPATIELTALRFAIVISPLAARMRPRWRGLTGVLALLGAGYFVGVAATWRIW